MSGNIRDMVRNKDTLSLEIAIGHVESLVREPKQQLNMRRIQNDEYLHSGGKPEISLLRERCSLIDSKFYL